MIRAEMVRVKNGEIVDTSTLRRSAQRKLGHTYAVVYTELDSEDVSAAWTPHEPQGHAVYYRPANKHLLRINLGVRMTLLRKNDPAKNVLGDAKKI